ncbi:hypothetical protein PAECIP111891_02146 [Paenibacillus allorhizoplanae]|uniref:HTH cro/C1-type domain-containing protein n=1 Tax=Paenibacillus allorhizoplanae TaxID=2905648 RepID=A0ABN8G8H2_9BACL|nr:helix-turn-helix domain-containing protein [Paenibacillus allorhizoplanae]CAH1202924.1 hypothetical protein PAECIP111891_02146 [Paenibacillus allorhizoplanae]
MDLKEFAIYFSSIREQSGFRSQRELADKSGVSHSTINRIESGAHKASPETLQILAKHLKDVTYPDLLEKLNYIPASSGGKIATTESNIGRAFFGGADQYTEDELEIARAAAQAAVEAYRKGLNKNK